MEYVSTRNILPGVTVLKLKSGMTSSPPCIALIKHVQAHGNNSPAEAIRLIRQLAYDVHLRHTDGKHRDNTDDEQESPTHHEEVKLEGRYDELEELMQIAKRYHTLRHFLDGMAQLKQQAEDTSKHKRDCVSLMTIH